MPLNAPLDDPVIERSLTKGGLGKAATTPVDDTPLYRMLGQSKIPVSKVLGSLWQSRRDQGLTSRGQATTTWDEAIRYYSNDQLTGRKSVDGASGNRPNTRLGDGWTETENVVFANCSIMVPMLYAKNPDIEITAYNEQLAPWAQMCERLGNILMQKKTNPGLNFKNKMRRAVLTALLTNSAIVKIGWTKKEDASETALQQLQDLSEQYAKAEKKKELKEIEGKIMALEEKIALLQSEGPFARNIMPHRIVADPTSVEPDYSDADWVMEWEFLPTDYINAVYGEKKDQQIVSVYEPTHILQGGSGEGIEDTVNNFKLIPDTSDSTLEANTYGYDDVRAFKSAQYTKVWYVWDRVTRRVLMFADNNWKWPIWVWDDPLKLPRFFPYFKLWFHESTNSQSPKGEVTYYLDQQDTINEINSEVRRGRQWARRNILFNKNTIGQDDVETVLRGDDGTARGVNVPEGMKLEDCIYSFIPPALKMPEFFSTENSFAAINRITGINDAMRGAQYKTNTTNQAIDAYQKNVDIRVDERTDLIEDFIGDIMHNILMLCSMYWEKDDLADLLPDMIDNWVPVTDPKDFETRLVVRVEGGSTDKPTSAKKKQQALQLGQILGQFANAAPATVIVMLKMFQEAFDELEISDSDWNMILQTMMQSLSKAGGGPGDQQGGGDAQPASDPQARTAEEVKARVQERIAKLPNEAKAKLEQMVQSGMPPAQALDKIEAELQQTP
jgi:flagellar motility protein MotE (MotC chaperone)